MRKIRRVTGLGTALLWGAVMCFGLAGSAAAQTGDGDQYCEVTLNKCPDKYDGDTLVVPLDVIAFSANVQACEITQSTVSQGGDPPAIMFIIDHSTSMTGDGPVANGGCGANGCDRNGSRFRVTQALIDSIYASFPTAEVGITIFSNGLVLDATRDANLVPYDGVYANDTFGLNQSYMPLRQLNAPALTGGTNPFADANDSPTIIDVYRGMFTAGTGGRWALNGRPELGGTNISLAFAAALKAFESTTIPKKDQYIIFLSDGAPGLVEERAGSCSPATSHSWCGRGEEFAAGVNTPTTYTVFLRGSEVTTPTAPVILQTMTANVQSNGYSETNPKGNIWAVNDGYSALLTLMMENIFKDMLTKSSGAPKRITISSTGGGADSTGDINNGNFNFRRQLPIDTSDITTVNMGIRYDVVIEEDTTINGVLTTVTRTIPDSLFEYSFAVRRTANPDKSLEEQDLVSKCRGKPTLELQYGGNPVREVKGNMDRLTVYFDARGGIFEYDEVKVQVMNADGTFTDVENFTLKQTSITNVWEYDFQRLVSDAANSGDGKLQHTAQDSIIVVFRNPYIPLDTLRVSVPYVSTTMAFYDTPGDPSGGAEIPDPVTVRAGESLDIFAKFFDSDGNWDQSMDPSKIRWELNDNVNAKLDTDGLHGAFYSETANRVYTVVATYTDGPLTITCTLHINVAPADPYYLDVGTEIVESKVDTLKLQTPTEYEFGRDESEATFYAVERDRFGNYIGPADGAIWEFLPDNAVIVNPSGDGRSAVVRRNGNGFAEGVLTVRKDGLRDGKVNIRVVGESVVAVGPNPFVPGKSSVKDRLQQLDPSGEVYRNYEGIIERTGAGGGGGSPSVGVSNNGNGVLVAATAPRSIKRNSNGTIMATIVIYDAVGNVVFKSKPGDVRLASNDSDADGNNTFGFVWDGKNSKGRTVGPGTYLVRMVGTQTDGTKFSDQRKVGVTTDR